DGRRRWTLDESLRSDLLRHTDRPLLVWESQTRQPRPDDSLLQQKLDNSIRLRPIYVDLSGMSLEELRVLSVIARWWKDGNPVVPGEAEVASAIRRLELFSEIRAMANQQFVGRETVLMTLRSWRDGPERIPFVVHGPGGSGKSALIARFVAET